MKLSKILVPPKPKFDSTVKDILDSAEYSHLGSGIGDFFENIERRLSQWLYERFNGINLDEAAEISKGLSTVFMIIGLIAFAAIIITIVVVVSRTFERKTRLKEILGERIDEKTTPASLRRQAEAYKKAGEYRWAIRYDYIALLLMMHENGLLFLDETKTNLEIYDFLKKKQFSRLSELGCLIDIFNSSWYGHIEYNHDVYDAWAERLNLLWNEAISYEEKK